MNTLVLATNNPHKLNEFRDILSPYDWKVLSPKDLGIYDFNPEETGSSFLENARIKSRALFQLSGIPSLADDSGLVIEALNGEPGVHSARYGGIHLTDKDRALLVLGKMNGISNRIASFHCVLSFTCTNEETCFHGSVEGEIGNCYMEGYGFGYDPIFYYPPLTSYFSELSPADKNKVSHRYLAIHKFLNWL